MPFVDDGLCIASGADAVREVHQVDDLVTDSPAGVYSIVGCEKDSVTTMYVGQSQDVLKTTLQHQICYGGRSVPLDEEARLVCYAPKACDEVFHFRLPHFAAEDEKRSKDHGGGDKDSAGIDQWREEMYGVAQSIQPVERQGPDPRWKL